MNRRDPDYRPVWDIVVAFDNGTERTYQPKSATERMALMFARMDAEREFPGIGFKIKSAKLAEGW